MNESSEDIHVLKQELQSALGKLALAAENEAGYQQREMEFEDEIERLKAAVNEKIKITEYFHSDKLKRAKILFEVSKERDRQDNKQGGMEHDYKLTVADFVRLIEDYALYLEDRGLI